MSKPEPVKMARGPRPNRSPARSEPAKEPRAVRVDERWRAWVFYEDDAGPSQPPGHHTTPSRATP